MARSRNLLVVKDGIVLSMTPKNLKSVLENISSGGPSVAVQGKRVGSLVASADLSSMPVGIANHLLSSLFPTVESVADTAPTTTVDFPRDGIVLGSRVTA